MGLTKQAFNERWEKMEIGIIDAHCFGVEFKNTDGIMNINYNKENQNVIIDMISQLLNHLL